jgi:5-formyltetrahydrofolate cyclo-ligase
MAHPRAPQPAKDEARRRQADARRALPPDERGERSRRIFERLRSLPAFRDAAVVCAYVGCRDEVETVPLLEALLAEGRRVAVPLHVPGAEQPLLFAEIASVAELSPSRFGVLEPERSTARLLPTAAIPVFLVPGLAFDPTGRRLGYGLGCYDRAFAEAAPDAVKVGLAFELQLLERVPTGPHDVPMDFVVTEDRVIPAAAGAGSPTRRC